MRPDLDRDLKNLGVVFALCQELCHKPVDRLLQLLPILAEPTDVARVVSGQPQLVVGDVRLRAGDNMVGGGVRRWLGKEARNCSDQSSKQEVACRASISSFPAPAGAGGCEQLMR